MGIPEMPHLDVLAEVERKKTFLDRGLPHVHIQVKNYGLHLQGGII
jgi:hypothetical protein